LSLAIEVGAGAAGVVVKGEALGEGRGTSLVSPGDESGERSGADAQELVCGGILCSHGLGGEPYGC
jgi:hypothetical protein